MKIEAIKERTEDVLRGHEEILSAYLYGSFARGTNDEASDVDVGLLLAEGYNPDPLYESRISIELDKNVGGRVEARVLNNKPLVYLHQVLKYGKRLFSKDEKSRIRFEVDTYSRYLDIKPFYEEYNRVRRMRLLV